MERPGATTRGSRGTVPSPFAALRQAIYNTPHECIHFYLFWKGSHMAGKAPTKSEILASIASSTELSRKQVASVFDAVAGLIGKGVGKKGPGVFVFPGLMKIMVVQKPAVAARQGINPFTKQEQMFKAKPARKVIKVRALKALKDMAK